jgi:hypothetical protein
MDYLIDQSQTAYIKSRMIMNNIVCAHEVLHQVRFSKTKGVFFLKSISKRFLIVLIEIFFWGLVEIVVLELNGLHGLNPYLMVVKLFIFLNSRVHIK